MIQKIYCYLLIIIFFSINLLAQNKNGNVYGMAVDEGTNNPIPFVNVLLLRTTDSSVVYAAATNKSGKFDFINVADGDYLIKFSCIGFHELIKPGIKIGNVGRKLNTSKTELISSITDLDEVVVTSKKETFNNSVDRKVYNVEQDIMSKSGTAGDLLQNIPSVSVDIDGNVSLRGSQNVMIMINGKTSPLMDKSSATVLDEMPANSIERIEVITNPSASFKPDGTSGIINIVMKKNTSTGLNSNITFNLGNKSRYNTNWNFNYNPGKFNVYGNYGFRQDDRTRSNNDSRDQTDSAGTKSYYSEVNGQHGRPVVHLANLGGEYNFNQYNKIGIQGNYFYQDATRSGVASQINSDLAHNITQNLDRQRISPELEKEYDATLNYLLNFGREDHELEFEFKVSHSPELEQNYYTDVYRFPAGIPNGYDNDAITQNDDKKEITLKYKNSLSENSSFEAGYSGEFNSSEMDLYVDYFDNTLQKLVKDTTKSSHFFLNKKINALYSTYENKIGNFSFMAGLRLEQAVMNPQLLSLDSSITNKYFNLFPTLHLQYNLSKEASLQLNYSKRVHRPHDDDLNPFPEYQDPRNVRAGNPNLLPEYIHSLEFGCQINYEHISFVPGIYYRYTTNRFTQITQQFNDSVILTTQQNLNFDQSGGLEFVVSGSVVNFFSTQLSLNGFYEQIDASNLGYNVKSSAYSWAGTLSFNFNVTSTTMFQVNSNYRSLRLTPQGEIGPSYVVNCGLRQDLFDERVSLIFTVSDIFNTLRQNTTLNTPDLNDYSTRQRDGQIVYLGVTYHIGKTEKKKEKMEYDDNL
jgi:outer membrane receptor protein involved in Fe transport